MCTKLNTTRHIQRHLQGVLSSLASDFFPHQYCEHHSHKSFCSSFTVLARFAKWTTADKSQRGRIDRQLDGASEKEERGNAVLETSFLHAAAPADGSAVKKLWGRCIWTGSFDPLPEGNWSCYSLCYLFNLKLFPAEHGNSAGFLHRLQRKN